MINSKFRFKLTAVVILAIMLLLSKAAIAESLTSVVHGLDTSVRTITKMVQVICVVIGVGLTLGALIRFKSHRDNPEEISLMSCIFMLIGGLALIALYFLPMPK
ncbi:MAG: hypothetical protein HWD59_07320 [Coxiellaceae bacterium]|nr:MAG: hypothetical protein HWD59_07320 [Coxiellaceae bacterium]